jgi:flagellar biosynthesis protein FlhF
MADPGEMEPTTVRPDLREDRDAAAGLAKRSEPHVSTDSSWNAEEKPANADSGISMQAMSTVSFQQYVRDRLARKQAMAASSAVTPESSPGSEHGRAQAPVAQAASSRSPAALEPQSRLTGEKTDSPIRIQTESGTLSAQLTHGLRATATPALSQLLGRSQPLAADSETALMAQLQAISSQLSSLTWLEGVRRNPLQAQLLKEMVRSGFSSVLARKLVSRLPSDFSHEDAKRWMSLTLAGLIGTQPAEQTLIEHGGMFAMVGPTGVGKTTSAAKIAAQFAMRHGAASVGLITIDAYRVGGQDQLRTFGRLLGVPVHVAYDTPTLQEFLRLLAGKKLVLVDTAGVGQRDERLNEMLESLSALGLGRLLVLNAASQAETLEDVVRAYRGREAAGVVISKLDEAVKTGAVLDCVIRHRLHVAGVANGQRVPEDWLAPDPKQLVAHALSVQAESVFDLDESELSLIVDGLSTQVGAKSTGSMHA